MLEGFERRSPLPADYNFGDDLDISTHEASFALDEVKLLAPVAPSKIVCVGRNYREHAAELGNKMPDEPLLFLESAVGGDRLGRCRSSCRALRNRSSTKVSLVSSSAALARKLSRDDDPLSYVFGYTCVNDVTARDLQRKDVQFTRGKSFDTFCPVGPWIETEIDPRNVAVETRLNGEVKQKGNTADMAFPVAFLIRYISEIMTLYPGDLIATGTPAAFRA